MQRGFERSGSLLASEISHCNAVQCHNWLSDYHSPRGNDSGSPHKSKPPTNTGLFSIEEIGHLIEEPFSPNTNQLPLEAMTRTISRDVRRLLRVPEDDEQHLAAWVDEDLLSAEDREFAENAPRSPDQWRPIPARIERAGGMGGAVLASSSMGGRNGTMTALQSTEAPNI